VNSDKLKIAFGKVLLSLRSEKGLSQQELGDSCELERAYISRIERGLQLPSLTVIFKISSYFQITPGELIDKVYNQIKRSKG
jgi:transcriptional regulator with XRE-family HTH domain